MIGGCKVGSTSDVPSSTTLFNVALVSAVCVVSDTVTVWDVRIVENDMAVPTVLIN